MASSRSAVETAARLVERGHFRRLGRGSYLVESLSEPDRWYPVVNRWGNAYPDMHGARIGGPAFSEDYRVIFCACEAGWSGQTCGHALYSEWLRTNPNARSKT